VPVSGVRITGGRRGTKLTGEIFEPLRDRAYFCRFQVNPDVHTVTWLNGADFAPEFLYGQIKVPA
jgi:hypothetical protein